MPRKRSMSAPASKSPASSSEPHLSPWELLSIERHERAVVEAQAKVAATLYEMAVLKAEHAKLTQALGFAQAEGKQALEAAKAEHANFLKKMATRYSVSWDTHGFHPETGAIQPTDA